MQLQPFSHAEKEREGAGAGVRRGPRAPGTAQVGDTLVSRGL